MAITDDEDLSLYLRSTPIIESEHPEIVEFAQKHIGDATTDIDKAVRLFYAVRDGVRYDPYTCVMTLEGLQATTPLRSGRGWCVTKAVLLSACCRSQGVPARLGFADVRNHLSTAALREIMGTDVFYWHGYSSIRVNEKWVKATPAFNKELCDKFNLLPLEFDGLEDSIYHPFDADGRQHMEYVRDRGEFADVPLDLMEATFLERYGNLRELEGSIGASADFDREVEEETESSG